MAARAMRIIGLQPPRPLTNTPTCSSEGRLYPGQHTASSQWGPSRSGRSSLPPPAVQLRSAKTFIAIRNSDEHEDTPSCSVLCPA
uniref:Uncharacterized protein n=1 Tax=Triticum urartu TaxID=4572 RepID=A0A8R7QNE8_TRIUA